MSEGTDTDAVEQWDADREWHPTDDKWSMPPQQPDPDREPRISYDRGKCPLLPNEDYLVLRVDKVDFLTMSGLAVATDEDGTGVGSHAPILTVIRVGPDVTKYKPGDYVLTNPRNNELGIEWADPRPPHASVTYIMMKEKVILARYDHEVIEQMKKRARHCAKMQKAREAAIAKEKAFQESELNPIKGQELVDALGNPISKSGMHEEEIPEGLTADTSSID